jgi:predicted P-loop ATPase
VQRHESVESGERAEHDPVLDWLEERGDVVRDKGEWIEVLCPWRDGHTPGRDDGTAYRPLDVEGTRGFNCMHSHCKERRTGEYLAWVAESGGPGTGPDPSAMPALGELLLRTGHAAPGPENYGEWRNLWPRPRLAALPDLKMTSKGPAAKQTASRANVESVVRQAGAALQLNMLTREYEVILPERLSVGWYARQSAAQQQRAARDALRDFCMLCHIEARERVDEHLEALSSGDRYHPFEKWIREQRWDGRSRLEQLAASVRLDNPEHGKVWRAYLRRWLVLAVRTALGFSESGFNFGNAGVLVLQGPQGCGKTSWLASLLPDEFFREGLALHLNGSNARDAKVEALSGSVICELGELESTFTKSDSGALKNFLSSSKHKFRLPFAREWVEWRRTTTYCASVNQSGFLNDATGSRRFWIMAVEQCDPFHGIDMRQLWAEVLTLAEAGEQSHLTQQEEAWREGIAGDFAEPDEVADRVGQWLNKRPPAGKRYPLTITEIAQLAGIERINTRALAGARCLVERATGARSRKFGAHSRVWFVRLAPVEANMLVGKKALEDGDEG